MKLPEISWQQIALIAVLIGGVIAAGELLDGDSKLWVQGLLALMLGVSPGMRKAS